MGVATLLVLIPSQAQAVDTRSVIDSSALEPAPIIENINHIEDESALVSPNSVLPTVAPLMKELPKQLTTTQEIKDYIVLMANRYKVSSKLLLAIAKAESGYIINAKNQGSTASGIFQYINKTFFDYCIIKYGLTSTMKDKNNPKIQIECAALMIRDGGVSHWSESQRAWQYAWSHAIP